MRIIQVTNRFFPAIGGVESHVFDLSRKLVNRGHQVRVLTSDLLTLWPPIELSNKYPRDQSIKEIKIKRLNVPIILKIKKGYYPFYPSLIRKILDIKADIIHLHCLHDFPAVTSFPAKLSGKKVVLTTHLNPKGRMLKLKHLYDKSIGKILVNFLDAIIGLTSSEITYLQKTFGKSSWQKLSLIPPAIDLSRFIINKEKIHLFKENYNLKSTKNILYVGRISEEKGLFYLLKAFSMIKRKKSSQMKLILVGEDTGFKKRLLDFSRKKGIHKNVIFTGALLGEDLIAAYKSADIFILPSLFENFGYVLLEAMAAGLPVISTHVGCAPEIIVEGKMGLLVPPEDPTSLMKAMLVFLNDGDLRKKIGYYNKKNVERKYDLNRRVFKIEKLYQKITGN